MTVVHHRKAPTRKKLNFGNKTYYYTEASCGVYSEVPSPYQGMKHTDVEEEVTCEKCLEVLAPVEEAPVLELSFDDEEPDFDIN